MICDLRIILNILQKASSSGKFITEDNTARVPSVIGEDQKERSARLAVMRYIVRSLVDSEERGRNGMKWNDILVNFRPGGADPRKAVDDLIALKYVVCITECNVVETSGDVHIKTLCEVYGTTFFGRKWLLEQERADQSGRTSVPTAGAFSDRLSSRI
jgi:hypothetical protein